MRISDWSSDVCSSDLAALLHHQHPFLKRSALTREGLTLREGNGPPPSVQPAAAARHRRAAFHRVEPRSRHRPVQGGGRRVVPGAERASAVGARSEEHTSELQSLMRISYAVFCLKKKK